MEFVANFIKDGTYWIAEIKELEVMTQGKTQKELIFMIQDLMQEMLFDQFEEKIECCISNKTKNSATLFIPDHYAIPLVLKRLRSIKGKTIKEISNICGFKSKNAYAQYEQGRRMPSIEQFSKFLEKMGGKLKIAVSF